MLFAHLSEGPYLHTPSRTDAQYGVVLGCNQNGRDVREGLRDMKEEGGAVLVSWSPPATCTSLARLVTHDWRSESQLFDPVMP